MKYLLIPALLLFACNNTAQQEKKDSDIVSAAEQMVPVAPPPVDPNFDQQLNGQDTLFEDGSIPSSWHNAGFDDPADFKRFILRFKEWVKEDKVDSIAAYIRFPLKNYPNETTFRKAYPKIFDAELKAVVDTQRLDRISRDYHGAMLGRGQIWFSVFDGQYRIIAINK